MRGTTFWKTFAKTLPVMLLTGIVGPIFLVLYFVLDDSPGWMLWTGSVIVGIVVALAVLVSWKRTTAARRLEARAAHGVPAIGRIVGTRDTGTEINGRRVVVFHLEVDGPRVEPFTTRITSPVPASLLGALATGRLGVFVDDDRTVTADWKATALYSGQLPARFVSEAREATYDLTGRHDELLRIVDVLRRHGIALSGTLDIRDNPEARSEIQTIVDEFAESFDAAAAKQRSVSRRLSDVDDLLKFGQITPGEHDALRSRILNSI